MGKTEAKRGQKRSDFSSHDREKTRSWRDTFCIYVSFTTHNIFGLDIREPFVAKKV
jgi:hypothetical protein